MSAGLAAGLAYRHDTGAAVSRYQQEEALERARNSERLAANQMLFEGMENAPQVMGVSDREYVKQFYTEQIQKIGEIGAKNPNWAYDTESFAEVMTFKKGYQTDPRLTRAVSSTAQYTQMQEFRQKHPELANTPEMIQNQQNWETYSKNGFIDPVTESGFTFINPAKREDTAAATAAYAKSVIPTGYETTALGNKYRIVDEASKYTAAVNWWNQQGPQGIAIKYEYEQAVQSGNWDPNQGPMNWMIEKMNPFFEKKALTKDELAAENTEKGYQGAYNTMFTKGPINTQSVHAIKNMLDLDKDDMMVLEKSYVPPNLNSMDVMKQIKSNGNFDPGAMTEIKSLQNAKFVTKPTGRVFVLGANSTVFGDETASVNEHGNAAIGVEVAIEIPLSAMTAGDQRQTILEEMEKAGLFGSTDWRGIISRKKNYEDISEFVLPEKGPVSLSSRMIDGKETPVLIYNTLTTQTYNQSTQQKVDSFVSQSVPVRKLETPQKDVAPVGSTGTLPNGTRAVITGYEKDAQGNITGYKTQTQ